MLTMSKNKTKSIKAHQSLGTFSSSQTWTWRLVVATWLGPSPWLLWRLLIQEVIEVASEDALRPAMGFQPRYAHMFTIEIYFYIILCIHICLSVCLPACLSACLSLCVYIYISVCVWFYVIYNYIYMWVYCMYVCTSNIDFIIWIND